MKKAFDLEKIYDEQIAPLMTQVIEICKKHNLPFVIDFQYSSDGGDEHGHCTSAYLPNDIAIAPELQDAYRAVAPRRSLALNITTRDKDGKIVAMETILP